MKRVFLVPVLAALAACGPLNVVGGSAAPLSVDRQLYAPGDAMTLTLTNRSQDEVGYNLCPAILEVRQGAAWARGPDLTEACTMELRLLAPGASATFPHRLPASLAPGEYRVRVNVEWPTGSGMASVATGPFRVQR
jgi:hypothetical protein